MGAGMGFGAHWGLHIAAFFTDWLGPVLQATGLLPGGVRLYPIGAVLILGPIVTLTFNLVHKLMSKV